MYIGHKGLQVGEPLSACKFMLGAGRAAQETHIYSDDDFWRLCLQSRLTGVVCVATVGISLAYSSRRTFPTPDQAQFLFVQLLRQNSSKTLQTKYITIAFNSRIELVASFFV